MTGAVAVGSWPCPQCAALGRTGPLTYVSDGGTVPDDGNMAPTEIPSERLEAFLASFAAPAGTPPSSGGRPPGRKARREAERRARRGKR